MRVPIRQGPGQPGLGAIVLVAVIALAAALPLGCEASGGQTLKIFDGDSFLMRGDDGDEIEVRIFGIDAPERHQPWSQRSREALRRLIRGHALSLKVVDTDRYGRVVARVSRKSDGLVVNTEMVRTGDAWVYRRYTGDKAQLRRLGLEDLLDLEQQAREAGRGLWSLPKAEQTPPWEWRRQNRGN